MRLIGMLLLVALPIAGPAFATDKTSPDFLRHKHAGTASFTSTEPVRDLFPKLLRASEECWVGEVKPGAGTGSLGGAIGTMSSASRIVLGELSGDGQSAYVLVRVKGMFGALQSNFLQIDLAGAMDGSHLDVFYKNNVKGQKQFVGQVEHWLNGELNYCDPDPLIRKTTNGG
jgi:hypothetical protein